MQWPEVGLLQGTLVSSFEQVVCPPEEKERQQAGLALWMYAVVVSAFFVHCPEKKTKIALNKRGSYHFYREFRTLPWMDK